MAAKSALDLLPAVRRHVLYRAASGHTLLALGAITLAVDSPKVLGNPKADRPLRRMTMGRGWSKQKRTSKLGHRGWVHACLSRLAKEGLLWERQRPEYVVHDHSDKFFRVRISKAAARARLKSEFGVIVVDVPDALTSCYWTKSLEKS